MADARADSDSILQGVCSPGPEVAARSNRPTCNVIRENICIMLASNSSPVSSFLAKVKSIVDSTSIPGALSGLASTICLQPRKLRLISSYQCRLSFDSVLVDLLKTRVQQGDGSLRSR